MSPSPAAPGASGLARVVKDVTGFVGSQYFIRFATLLKGFVVARLLGPTGNGLWQHFVLISEYCIQAQLGVLPGLSKDLGHRIGRGDEAGAVTARETGTTGIFFSALFLWVCLCGYVAWRWSELPFYDRLGLPLLGLIVVFEQINFTYMALLRAYSRIKIISVIAAVFAAANLVVSVTLLLVFPRLHVFALLIGWFLTRGTTMLWMIRRSGYPFRLKIRWAMVRTLVATGFPIFLFHLTRVGLRNIDRVLVDSVLAKSQLGIYGIAVTLAGLVHYVADAVAFVIYPILLRIYGETRDPTALRDHLVKPTGFLSMLVSAGLGLSYLVLHLPILWLLPAFVPSIEIYRLLTVSVAFYCLSILPGFYLMAIDRQNALIPLGVAAVAFNFFVGRFMIQQGHGLVGVAATMGAGNLLYCTGVLAYAGRFVWDGRGQVLAWIGRCYAPVAFFAALVLGIRAISPRTPLGAWGEAPRSAIEGLVFIALSLPALWIYEKKTGVVRRLRRRSPAAPPVEPERPPE